MTLTAEQCMDLATLDAIDVLGDVAHSTLIYLHLVGPFAHASIADREVHAFLVSRALEAPLNDAGYVVGAWLPGDVDGLGRPRPTAQRVLDPHAER